MHIYVRKKIHFYNAHATAFTHPRPLCPLKETPAAYPDFGLDGCEQRSDIGKAQYVAEGCYGVRPMGDWSFNHFIIFSSPYGLVFVVSFRSVTVKSGWDKAFR
jgi:hypothetical protein